MRVIVLQGDMAEKRVIECQNYMRLLVNMGYQDICRNLETEPDRFYNFMLYDNPYIHIEEKYFYIGTNTDINACPKFDIEGYNLFNMEK